MHIVELYTRYRHAIDASNGNGSSVHLAVVLNESMADVEMAHMPYKGRATAMTDLMAGQVQLMFSSLVAIEPHIKVAHRRIEKNWPTVA